MQNTESILVIRLGALGDVVGCFPVLDAIRRFHPNAHITFLTTPPFRDLMLASPYVDDVWTIQRWKFTSPTAWLSFAKTLRRKKFTRVYDLQRNDRVRIMSYLAPRQLQRHWYGRKGNTKRPPFADMQPHDFTPWNALDTSWLGDDISRFAIPSPYAVIVPGCSPQHPHKRWPAEKFVETLKNLLLRGITPVLIGTNAEEDVLHAIKTNVPETVNLCGQTSLFEFAELARHARFALGNDTGPMHLAGAVQCPTISLFSGRNDPERCKPRGNNALTLQAEPIDEIKVDDVMNILEQVISG